MAGNAWRGARIGIQALSWRGFDDDCVHSLGIEGAGRGTYVPVHIASDFFGNREKYLTAWKMESPSFGG